MSTAATTAPAGGFRLHYSPALDGLRGVAVLMVMAHHASLAPGGFLGVDVFFVLSGFLITALLLQEWGQSGTVSLGRFYARRALRLLPALLTLLSILLVAPGLFGLRDRPWQATLLVLFYVANWAAAFQLVNFDILNPTWSLAIEEQFYLAWPPLLTLLLARRVDRRLVLGLVLLGIASASAIRILLWDPGQWPRVYYGLDTRMDSLLLGCLVGLLAAWDMLPKRGWLLAATRYASVPAAATLFVLTYTAPPPDSSALYYGIELLVCVMVAVLIIALLTSSPQWLRDVLEQPALVWPGRISYGLYLWHVPVFHGLLNQSRMLAQGVGEIILTGLRFGATFAVAGTSFYLIEQPMLRLKDRFRGRPRTIETVAAPAPLVAAPDRPELYQEPIQGGAAKPGWGVLVDRRRGERRQRSLPVARERRVGERRGKQNAPHLLGPGSDFVVSEQHAV